MLGIGGTETIQLPDQAEIFTGSERIENIGTFRYIANAAFVGCRIRFEWLTEQFDRTGIRLEQAEHHFNGGTFTGTIRTNVTDNVAGGNREAEILENLFSAKTFHDMIQ